MNPSEQSPSVSGPICRWLDRSVYVFGFKIGVNWPLESAACYNAAELRGREMEGLRAEGLRNGGTHLPPISRRLGRVDPAASDCRISLASRSDVRRLPSGDTMLG